MHARVRGSRVLVHRNQLGRRGGVQEWRQALCNGARRNAVAKATRSKAERAWRARRVCRSSCVAFPGGRIRHQCSTRETQQQRVQLASPVCRDDVLSKMRSALLAWRQRRARSGDDTAPTNNAARRTRTSKPSRRWCSRMSCGGRCANCGVAACGVNASHHSSSRNQGLRQACAVQQHTWGSTRRSANSMYAPAERHTVPQLSACAASSLSSLVCAGRSTASSVSAPGTLAVAPSLKVHCQVSATVLLCRSPPSGLTFSTPPSAFNAMPCAQPQQVQTAPVRCSYTDADVPAAQAAHSRPRCCPRRWRPSGAQTLSCG